MVSKKQKAASAVARTGGSFLGGITNNPGIVVIALVLGGLFLFRDNISKGFSGLFEGLKFPEIPNPFENFVITNPFEDFKFPEFKNPFEDFKFPEFTNPFEDFVFPDFAKQFEGFQESFEGLFSSFQKQFEDFKFPELPVVPPLFKEDDETTTSGGGFGNDPRRPDPAPRGDLSGDEINNLPDIEDGLGGLTPAQRFNFIERGVIPTGFKVVDGVLVNEVFIGQQEGFVEAKQIANNLPSGFEVFQTPGSSFVGASINETPIEFLSLSQIIDKFDVTASQAANILAIAKDDFGDFDFGTNQGLGIGSIFADLNLSSLLPSGNVSSSQFEGKSATEIANLLTGGNIQNF